MQSDSGQPGSSSDPGAEEAAAAAAAAAALGEPAGPAPQLGALALARRRLGRTRAALEAYRRVQARLLGRLRESHRRFVFRNGHAGGKEAGACAAAAREAAGLGAGCAAAACARAPLPLARFCRAHIGLDERQVLYVAVAGGTARLRQASDAPPPP